MRLLSVLILMEGCGSGAGLGGGGVISGEGVFSQPLPDGNTFACATCHALVEPKNDGTRLVAHPLAQAPQRTSFKNGRLTRFQDAVNSCVTEWQAAEAWAAEDPRFAALATLFNAQPGSPSQLKFAIVAPPASLSGGDAARGHALFNRTCSVCHGLDGRGAERGPNLAGAKLPPEYVARRVRLSGSTSSSAYEGLTGGRMPFWAKDRLDDTELLDLVAYVSTSEVPDGGVFFPDAGASATDGGTPDAGVGATCGKTHPRIGWYADFTTLAHGVRGRATITDDCTITLTNFSYDGNGIDVRLYGALGKDFARGFSIGGQLYRPGQPYTDVTMTMRLPANRTLNEVESVSVWCVAARQNFGDGTFRAP